MTAQAVDTNVLLRAAIDSGDGQAAQARELLATEGVTFSTGPIVWAEFVHVLLHHYGLSRAQAGAVTRWVVDIESLLCQRDVILAALDQFEEHPKLSFEDCLIAEQASADGTLPVWTFDAKLANQHAAARLVA